MKFLISENQLSKLLKEVSYNPEVEEIQKSLIQKGYDLGKYGPEKDGVDGKAGPLTKAAFRKEFGYELVSKEESGEDFYSEYDAVLVGGMENRSGDKPLYEQLSLFKMGFGSNKKVKAFHHYDSIDTILGFMEQNPRIPVYLFSAGCLYSYELSMSPYVNLSKLFIIEPYAPGKLTGPSVRNAVKKGVPPYHVFVGSSVGRGKGIVDGTSSSKTSSHWDALTTVASMTK